MLALGRAVTGALVVALVGGAGISHALPAERPAAIRTAPDRYAATEDSPLAVRAPGVLRNDRVRKLKRLTIATRPRNGSVTLRGNGSFQYVATAGWSGTDSFTYRVVDRAGRRSTAKVTVVVAAVDDPTATADDAVTVAEDGTTSGNVLANDLDADSALQIVSHQVAGPGAFTMQADGAWTYTPPPDWHGSTRITYRTNTGATGTLTITVTPVADATTAAADTATTSEDAETSGNVLGNDTDADGPLRVASHDATDAHGEFSVQPDGDWTYTPSQDWHGTATIDYTTDSNATGTLTITVTPVADPTITAPDAATTPEDTATSGDVLTNDTDPDGPLTVASHTVDGPGTLDLQTDGDWTYTPSQDWHGTATIDYTTDSNATGTLTITVTAVDDPSDLTPDTSTVDEDTTSDGNVLANDADVDDDLVVASHDASVAPGTFGIQPDGDWTYTPSQDWHGTAEVDYTTNTGATGTLTLTVEPVADPTLTAPDTATTTEDAATSGNVLANDTDPDAPLAVASHDDSGAPGAFAIETDGDWTYTPPQDWHGTATVDYTTDTGSTETLTITVTAVDDPSELTADTSTVDEETVVFGNVLSNDSDVDSALTVTRFEVGGESRSVGVPMSVTGGTLQMQANGAYQFNPTYNWNGTVEVTYVTGTGTTGTLRITLTPVNDPPVAGAHIFDVPIYNSGMVFGNTLLGLATDPDGDPVSLTWDFWTEDGTDIIVTPQNAHGGAVQIFWPSTAASYSLVLYRVRDSHGAESVGEIYVNWI